MNSIVSSSDWRMARDVPENKDPGLWGTIKEPGSLKSQNPSEPNMLKDPGPYRA